MPPFPTSHARRSAHSLGKNASPHIPSPTHLSVDASPVSSPLQWLVGQLNVSEKVALLTNGSPGASRVGLPAYEWWSEALHGVAGSPGVDFAPSGDFSCATSFPEPIGLGATFDRQLIRAIATVTSDEARAFSNAGRAGLDFWSVSNLTSPPLPSHPTTAESGSIFASTALHSPPSSALLCSRCAGRPTSTSSATPDGDAGRRRRVSLMRPHTPRAAPPLPSSDFEAAPCPVCR